jgi:hypothetical protein
MAGREHFCTCDCLDCKLHPSNHDRGCDPSIQKNLKKGEMPSCFFNLVSDDLSGVKELTIDGFVQFCLANKKDQPQGGAGEP